MTVCYVATVNWPSNGLNASAVVSSLFTSFGVYVNSTLIMAMGTVSSLCVPLDGPIVRTRLCSSNQDHISCAQVNVIGALDLCAKITWRYLVTIV